MFDSTLLAHNIKKYRESNCISQKELAEKLFVSGQAISKWERGLAVPEIDKLCMLADLFGTSLDSLVGYFSDKKTLMIGIDGGGTKTEYVLFNENGRIFERTVSSVFASSALVASSITSTGALRNKALAIEIR